MKKFNIVKQQFVLYNMIFPVGACYGTFKLQNIYEAIWLIENYDNKYTRVKIFDYHKDKWFKTGVYNSCINKHYYNFIKPLIERNNLTGKCEVTYTHSQFVAMQANSNNKRRPKKCTPYKLVHSEI